VPTLPDSPVPRANMTVNSVQPPFTTPFSVSPPVLVEAPVEVGGVEVVLDVVVVVVVVAIGVTEDTVVVTADVVVVVVVVVVGAVEDRAVVAGKVVVLMEMVVVFLPGNVGKEKMNRGSISAGRATADPRTLRRKRGIKAFISKEQEGQKSDWESKEQE
jgi:hypothetical protein